MLSEADAAEFPRSRLLLGGDHLGPIAWQREPAAVAMDFGKHLAAGYVRAGFTKIHLDASMPLGGDPKDDLPLELSADRTAELCQAAEAAFAALPAGSTRPVYVVGTEVPPAGGARASETTLEVTDLAYARETLDALYKAFYQRGLEEAWQRVFALVVQPGVEFGDTTVHPYDREAASPLSRWIESLPGVVFEAHSTDYQSPSALSQMVEDHFAILKVGPALTFAFREAVFALELIEKEIHNGRPGSDLSHLGDVLEAEMLADPGDWSRYYTGDDRAQRLARRFSLSDRIRYYWPRPQVQDALDRLLANLQAVSIPLTLLSQFFPVQYARIRGEIQPIGPITNTPFSLIEDKIQDVLHIYHQACFSFTG
jgi:D-tagatose-1,6-bisphosphate aldolase subunit GatZ/KbaZ